MSGKERDKLLVVQFDATMGIDFKESLIDLLFADALEVKAQPAGLFLLHNSLTFFRVQYYARPVLRMQR